MQLDLLGKLLLGAQRSQRVRVGLGKKFDASGLGERLERVEHLGRIGLELLDGSARYGERAAELVLEG